MTHFQTKAFYYLLQRRETEVIHSPVLQSMVPPFPQKTKDLHDRKHDSQGDLIIKLLFSHFPPVESWPQ